MKRYLIALRNVTLAMPVLVAVIVAVNFPYNYDDSLSKTDVETVKKYYRERWNGRSAPAEKPARDMDSPHVKRSADARFTFRIEERVRNFVDRYELDDKAILEIGSGDGYLQDVVKNYTGLDIASTLARHYHKKFVIGSATALPFPDNSFDAIWSIWVFEHVPNPEQAFAEARRVIKDGGVMFLLPAWNVPPWAATGYNIRPYEDLKWWEKVVKTTIPLRESIISQAASTIPVRAVRAAVASFGPTRLRYRRLEPNYEHYWQADSDAVNSIDSNEAVLWFTTRGDECLSCRDSIVLPLEGDALIVRVSKG